MSSEQPKLDAIAAYDLIAPGFRELSERRRAYLDAVDTQIINRIPKHAKSLLDVGAGDGRRALRIAEAAGIREVALAEPSSGMRALIPSAYQPWDASMEALPGGRAFDVVLCLWNVLGHVPREHRVAGLRNLARLCTDGGVIFLDVLNRYNVAECGLFTVMGRRVRDTLLPSRHNGDVRVKWIVDGRAVETQGHTFTVEEVNGLLERAGLSALERVVLDYRTGRRQSRLSAGNLFYVLRPIR